MVTNDAKMFLEADRVRRMERERQELIRIWPDSNASLAGPAKLKAVQDAYMRYPTYRQQLLLRVAEVDSKGYTAVTVAEVQPLDISDYDISDYNDWPRGLVSYPIGEKGYQTEYMGVPAVTTAPVTSASSIANSLNLESLQAMKARIDEAQASVFEKAVKDRVAKSAFEVQFVNFDATEETGDYIARLKSQAQVAAKPAQKAIPLAPTPGRRKIRLDD